MTSVSIWVFSITTVIFAAEFPSIKSSDKGFLASCSRWYWTLFKSFCKTDWRKSQFCKGCGGPTGDTAGFPIGAQVFFKWNAEIFLHPHTLSWTFLFVKNQTTKSSLWLMQIKEVIPVLLCSRATQKFTRKLSFGFLWKHNQLHLK